MESQKNQLQQTNLFQVIAQVYVIADEENTHPAQVFLEFNDKSHLEISFKDDVAINTPLEFEELSGKVIEALQSGRLACSVRVLPVINFLDTNSKLTKELEELYITLWGRAAGEKNYEKKKWIRLGQIIRDLGILF